MTEKGAKLGRSLPEVNPLGTVTVAIPTFSFTRLPQLQKCLAGVMCNSLMPDDIIVVVDNNPELAAFLRKSYPDDRILIVESDGKGASAARNTALRTSTREMLVFIDDDVWPDLDWLETIVGTLCREGVGVVGGRILPDYAPGARALPPELLWLVGCTYEGHPMDRGPITRPIGSTMAFRRSVLKAVGGFNPAFGPIGIKRVNSNEELPLSRSIHRMFGDQVIWFEPQATVHHWVPAERSNLRWVLRRSWVEGRSKAAVRLEDDSSVMNHDRSYVTSTLLPRTVAYLTAGSLSDMRSGGRMLTAGAATALSFGVGRLGTRRGKRTPGPSHIGVEVEPVARLRPIAQPRLSDSSEPVSSAKI
jgi:glycosyltransferase involved in cell wall biosynthesis